MPFDTPAQERRFPVSEVEPAATPLPPLAFRESIASLLQKPVEACWPDPGGWVACTDAHPLAQAAHDAFYGHRPLEISVDMVWYCLAQGLAHHIHEHAEVLRDRLVQHTGQKPLVVERADFELGRDNPWPEVFAAFSEQIVAEIGPTAELLGPRFSTTGPVEQVAFHLTTMQAFQAYFRYFLVIGCGIPEIRLRGSASDWRALRSRVDRFEALSTPAADLEPWLAALRPVLDQLVASAEGQADPTFWQSFFRHESSSGPAELTGWILTLFPYLRIDGQLVPSPYLADWEERLRTARERKGLHFGVEPQGPPLNQIPSGLASAPVRCVDAGTDTAHDLRFVGGLLGVRQHPDLTLAPAFGWAVVHDADGRAEAPRPRPSPMWDTVPDGLTWVSGALNIEARRLFEYDVDQVFAELSLSTLSLLDVNAHHLRWLTEVTGTEGITSLSLELVDDPPPAVLSGMLARFPDLWGLSLAGELHIDGVRACLHAAPNLQALNLDCPPGPEMVRALAPSWDHLQELRLRALDLPALQTLTETAPPQLSRLWLLHGTFGGAGLALLAHAPLADGLTHLHLRNCGLEDADLEVLAHPGVLPALEQLDLRVCRRLTPEGVQALTSRLGPGVEVLVPRRFRPPTDEPAS